jgi:hypothetical protein
MTGQEDALEMEATAPDQVAGFPARSIEEGNCECNDGNADKEKPEAENRIAPDLVGKKPAMDFTFELDQWQKQAVQCLEANESVLVAVRPVLIIFSYISGHLWSVSSLSVSQFWTTFANMKGLDTLHCIRACFSHHL